MNDVPTKYLIEEDHAEIEYFTSRHNEYNNLTDQKNKKHNSKEALRKDYVLEEAEYDRGCDLADKMLAQRTEVFRKVAIRKGIIKENDVELKTPN